MPFSVEGHGETRESLARKVGAQVRELAAPVQVVEIEGGADGSGHPVFERRLVHDGFVERRHGQELPRSGVVRGALVWEFEVPLLVTYETSWAERRALR